MPRDRVSTHQLVKFRLSPGSGTARSGLPCRCFIGTHCIHLHGRSVQCWNSIVWFKHIGNFCRQFKCTGDFKYISNFYRQFKYTGDIKYVGNFYTQVKYRCGFKYMDNFNIYAVFIYGASYTDTRWEADNVYTRPQNSPSPDAVTLGRSSARALTHIF
jgi:hypothetical protein